MYRRLNIFLIIGAVFTIITGTLLHFVYEWSWESLFVGIFSPTRKCMGAFEVVVFPYVCLDSYWVFYFWEKIQNLSFLLQLLAFFQA